MTHPKHTTVVVVPVERITDWDSFHTVFRETLGFPDFYGRNMDAWIDCMTSVDDTPSSLTRVIVAPGDLLTLRIVDAADFERRSPEQFRALLECTAFVNSRRVEVGEEPVLSLILEGWFRK